MGLDDPRLDRHVEGQDQDAVRRLLQLLRIKPKTTYRVEFETDKLVARAVDAIRAMTKVEPPKVRVVAGQVGVTRAGVSAKAMSVAEEWVSY
jgi:type III restriction enzyme